MKATRAYIASIGTTGLLLAFAASLLLVVSALFAFNAWPGGESRDAVPDLVVEQDDQPIRVAGPELVARDAAAAARAVAPTPASRRPAGGAVPGGTDGGDIPGDGTPGGGIESTLDPGDGGDGDVTGGGPGPDPPIVPDVNVTDEVASSTEQITRTAGEGVGAVNPELGQTVSDTGAALSDIVHDLPDVQVGSKGLAIGD